MRFLPSGFLEEAQVVLAGVRRFDDQQHNDDRDIGHDAEQRRNRRRNEIIDDGLQGADEAEDQRIDAGFLRIFPAAVDGAQADKATVGRHVDGIHTELLYRQVQARQRAGGRGGVYGPGEAVLGWS